MLFPLEDSIFYILCSLVLLKQQKLVTVSKSSYSGMSLFSFWSLVHALSSGEAGEAEIGREKSSSHVLLLSASHMDECTGMWPTRDRSPDGNLHATAQINLSCEFHESGAQYDRFMDVGLGLKFIPS